MGKTRKVTNVLVLVERAPDGTIIENKQVWEGRATKKRLEKYVHKYVESLKVGGTNEHISKRLGYVPLPYRAVIKNQDSWQTRAEWKAPEFWVF